MTDYGERRERIATQLMAALLSTDEGRQLVSGRRPFSLQADLATSAADALMEQLDRGLGLVASTTLAWTFGQPDDWISIYPEDLAYFNKVLQAFPAIALVVELGTYKGGSAYMWTSAMQLRPGGHVVTYDNGEVTLKLGVPTLCEFVCEDVMTEDTQGRISRMIEAAATPVLLFCDNGAKPKEVELYGPRLRPGDVLAVHDWHDVHDNPDDNAVITKANAPAFVFDQTLWTPIRSDCWGPNMHARAWMRTASPWPA